MSSLYSIAIPPVIRGLKNTAAILTKALNQATNSNTDPQTYLTARLHPTMADLPKQVSFLTTAAKQIPIRLNPSLTELQLSDTPGTTFLELLERIKTTIEYLEGIKAEDIDGREGETVFIELGPRKMQFTPIAYLFDIVQPNFWFHVTTAYGILRKEGVDLSKGDYLNGAQLTKVE
ncbi:hypothetical protein K458DRAFT_297818 [Lentithecium fluviatile CBS 122367]|uniref:Uncharacterized protein n=1 Tax=Lentithecium fluviatile CBS 122367 TaxID=1168545 RepID=A0A6G1J926_9PLEO|nr:hypothetical protein K458DRAFT_297818 [Lentithecium fluviatile CBS 122367]